LTGLARPVKIAPRKPRDISYLISPFAIMAKGSKKGVQNDHFFGTFGIRMAKGVKKGGHILTHFWTPFWTPYVPNSPLKCVSFDQKGVQKGVQKVVKNGHP
jgi:hypothetical protein